MKRCIALIVVLLLAPVLIHAPAWGDERQKETSTLKYRRILAPADRMVDWPTGEGKYLPLETQEFERLLAQLKATGDSTPAIASCQIRRAAYHAALEGGQLLIGKAEWEIALTAEPPVSVPLGPCNLSIRNSRWGSISDKKKEGEKIEQKGVLLGANSQGMLALVAEHSGKLQFDWSLAGQREVNDNMIFSGKIPSASANVLVLDLPEEFMPQIEQGMVLEPQTLDSNADFHPKSEGTANDKPAVEAGRALRRWTIELGGNNGFSLKLIPRAPRDSAGSLPLLYETRSYEISPRGVEVSAQWKIQGRGELLRQVAVLLDPGLQLTAARCGEAAITWTLEALPNNQGHRAILHLPSLLSESSRTLGLNAVAPLAMDRLWRLPRIRPEGVAWEGGIVNVTILHPLFLQRLTPLGCSQTAMGPASAPRLAESAQFRCFNSTATVDVALALPREEVTATVATSVEIGSGEILARVTGEFRSAEPSSFVLEAKVARAWRIDEVAAVPAEAIADWNLETRSEGEGVLTIRLAKSIRSEHPTRVIVAARRLRLPSERNLKFLDLQPLRYLPPITSSRFLSLTAVGANELKIQGNNQPRRILPKDLSATERELFARSSAEMLFAEDGAAADAEVVVEKRRPEYSATIQTEAEVIGNRLQESWKFHCVPALAPVGRILVQLSEKSETSPRWKAAGAEAITLTARQLPKDKAAGGGKKISEIWEITLSRPQNLPFELLGARETALESSHPIALASLPEASHQNATLIIRRAAKTGIRIENRRLKRLPPDPASIESSSTAWATFSYDPARDAAASSEPPLLLIADGRQSSSACAWSVLLESWHEPGGLSRYLATWELQLGDRDQARITLPQEVDQSEVSGVWIDNQPAAWQPILEINTVAEKDNPCRFSVSLPTEKRFTTLIVEFTERERPLKAAGVIASRLPSIDLPVLSAAWRMWLPPSYETVDGQLPGLPLFKPHTTIGKRLWGPLGREEGEQRFHIFAAEDWVALAEYPARLQERRNPEKIEKILCQAIENAKSERKTTKISWRDVLNSHAADSTLPRLLVDRFALDQLGLSGETPLPELSGNDAAHALEELLQKTRLALLVSGDLVLLTSQTSAALYSRQWTSPDWPEVGILAPGPLVDRLKEASRSEREERYLPARVWARLPSMPESPWDRGSSTGVKHLELPGWNAAQRELSLEEPVSMNYIHRPTFQIAGSVTFMVIVALGWWFLLRRFLVLMPLAAGFALAALAFSEPFAALASWAMLGIFFCIFLSFVIRKQVADKLEETRSANSTNKPSLPKRIENTVNPSKIRMSYKGENSAVKLLLIAATLSVASLSNAEVPKKDAVASPPSPVYRVFVPTDAAKKPVGDKVYVSEKFYNELYRRAASVSEKPRDWLLTSAVYRGMLVHESTSGQIALDALKAQFDLRTFNRAVRVRIPLRRENVIVPANSVLLDGRPLSVQWDSDGMAITFTVDEPGKYRLEFPLQPRIPIGSGGAGFEISIPRLPVARLELLLPSELPVVEVPSALGKVTQESEPPRVVADLGPTDRLLVNWREAGKGASVAEVEKLVWLKVQPGSVTFDVLLKGNALAGLTKLQLAADPRLRLQPLSGRELPTVQMQNSSDQPQIITLEWAQPLPEQATVALSFLMTGVSGVGNLRLPLMEVQHLQTARRWLAVSVDPQLEYSSPGSLAEGPGMKPEVEAAGVSEFLKAWGTTTSAPLAAYRLTTANGWTLFTKPREANTTAEPTLALSFDRGRVDVDFSAQLTTVSGYVFQYSLLAPKELSVQTISLKKDGMEMVNRWAQESDGMITVFLKGPAEGRQELKLVGTMPLTERPTLLLPALRFLQVNSQATLVRVYRRPGVLLELTPPLSAIPELYSQETTDFSDRGRLVRAYWVGEKSPAFGEVDLKPNQPVFKAKQLVWLRQEDRQWRAGIDCQIEVVEGLVDELQFDASPAWKEPYAISMKAAISATELSAEKHRVTIALPETIANKHRFSISGLLKFEPGERPRVPEIMLRQAADLSRFLALPRQLQGQETKWETSGLSEGKLPDEFAGSIDPSLCHIYEAASESPQAVLQSQEQKVASARVDLADIQVAWQSDGALRGVATFDLTPGGMSICPLQLPSGCELIAVTIDGQTAEPQSDAQGGWRLNLNSSRLPQHVAVVYRATIAAADRPGMHEFPPPTLGSIPVVQTLWTVVGPSSFTHGQCQEEKPVSAAKRQWIRFRQLAGMIERGAELFTEDNEETRRWYQLNLYYWTTLRAAVMREWLPISQTEIGLSMGKDLESLDQQQWQLAERLNLGDVLHQLLTISSQADEPAQSWRETLFDPATAVSFNQEGRLTSLELYYDWTEKAQTGERIWLAAIILGILAMAVWGLRGNYGNRVVQIIPFLGHVAGAALGLLWWLWLSPSWLGLAIILISLASWGWSWRHSRATTIDF